MQPRESDAAFALSGQCSFAVWLLSMWSNVKEAKKTIYGVLSRWESLNYFGAQSEVEISIWNDLLSLEDELYQAIWPPTRRGERLRDEPPQTAPGMAVWASLLGPFSVQGPLWTHPNCENEHWKSSLELFLCSFFNEFSMYFFSGIARY